MGAVTAQAAAAASPQFAGLFRFDVTVPNLPAGADRISLSVNGVDLGQTSFTSIGQPQP